MSASAAIADPLLRRTFGQRARRSCAQFLNKIDSTRLMVIGISTD
jgi:hypothetical protein